MKNSRQLGGDSRRFRDLSLQTSIDAPSNRVQQLASILEVAAPQHGRAFTGPAVGRIRLESVIDDANALRWRQPDRRLPTRAFCLARLHPIDGRRRSVIDTHASECFLGVRFYFLRIAGLL